MTSPPVEQLLSLLRSKGIVIDKGLTEQEVVEVENKFDFTFPPDLKLLLLNGLPVGSYFPHWREALSDQTTETKILDWLAQPLQGILFDIENNNYWDEKWGKQAATMPENISVVRQHFKNYPKLIPIFAHRYIACEPNEEGNPVYSVHQTDIIYYGFDLWSYIAIEFNFFLPAGLPIRREPKKTIPFWSELLME